MYTGWPSFERLHLQGKESFLQSLAVSQFTSESRGGMQPRSTRRRRGHRLETRGLSRLRLAPASVVLPTPTTRRPSS